MTHYRIRHSQLHLQKRENRQVSWIEHGVRIGDLVALMICAEQARVFGGHQLSFQLMSPIHQSLRADVLFRNTIHSCLSAEGPHYGLGDPNALPIFDPGPLWIASTLQYARHGGAVIPRLCLDSAIYQGHSMPSGDYAVFHPLFDPPYNTGRGMNEAFVHSFCEAMLEQLGDRAVVITDHPEKIRVPIRIVSSESLYDQIYFLGKAKIYIGGDTGFTHFAAAVRVPHLFALYGPIFGQDATSSSANLCFGEHLYPFTPLIDMLGVAPDTRPKYDPDSTVLYFHQLEQNRLSIDNINNIVDQFRQLILG